MSINQRLDLRQSQNLTMTPELQQAIKLLQLSNLELSEFIEDALEKNPLLEKDRSKDGDRKDNQEESASSKTNDSVGDNDKQASKHEDNIRAESDANREINDKVEKTDLDADFDNVWTGNSEADKKQDYDYSTNNTQIGSGGSSNFDYPDYNFENTISEKPSLKDHLMEQIQLNISGNKDRNVAITLIDYLDEAGYMRDKVEIIMARLGCSKSRVEKNLQKMKDISPTGIFAKDLSECLALQLSEMNRLDPAMQALLDNLHLIADADLKAIEDICGVDREDVLDMITEIKVLDPKPALQFDHFISQTVIPDIIMKKIVKEDGSTWSIELNSETLPKVLINQTYYKEIKTKSSSKADKTFINDQMAEANWLVRAMDQRANTIMKVATEIIKKQDAFFNYGIEYLKPMVLKEIAKEIEMHESTVSRVTNNKFIGTPRGVFELKFFFSSGVSSTDGLTDYASDAIKARIKTLIDAEDPKKILSDDKLVKLLKEGGIEIARRTVAKYREAMHIPSSVQRRKLKKNL